MVTELSAAFARITCTASSTTSVATTVAPAFAASTAASPKPAPISSTRSPALTGRWRQKKREPAFGGCTPSGTRNRQSRYAKSRTPSSTLPALHLPEIEAKGLLQRGARARRRLGVLQRVDVDRQGHALLLDAVQLRGEAAALVGLREDQLGLLEGAVVARDLLHGLHDHALELLRLVGGYSGEGGGEATFRHRCRPSGCPRGSWRRWRGWQS